MVIIRKKYDNKRNNPMMLYITPSSFFDNLCATRISKGFFLIYLIPLYPEGIDKNRSPINAQILKSLTM